MTPRMNRQLRRKIVRQACDATPAAARKMPNQLLGHQRLLCVPFLWQDQEMYASIFVRGPLPDVPKRSVNTFAAGLESASNLPRFSTGAKTGQQEAAPAAGGPSHRLNQTATARPMFPPSVPNRRAPHRRQLIGTWHAAELDSHKECGLTD